MGCGERGRLGKKTSIRRQKGDHEEEGALSDEVFTPPARHAGDNAGVMMWTQNWNARTEDSRDWKLSLGLQLFTAVEEGRRCCVFTSLCVLICYWHLKLNLTGVSERAGDPGEAKSVGAEVQGMGAF